MIVLFFYCLAFARGMNIPEGIEICHKSHPNFGNCVAKFIETALKVLSTGNRDLDIPSLEPLYVKEMKIAGSSGTSLSIQQRYHDVRVYGTTDSVYQMLDFSIKEGCYFRLKAFIPLIRLEGDYELQGQVIVIPINAKGKFIFTLNRLNNIHTFTCEEYKNKNQTYMKMASYDIDMNVNNILYNFTDIFPENQHISEEIIRTLNDNGLSIFKEFKAGFESIFSNLQMQNFNRFLSKFTQDQFFPE